MCFGWDNPCPRTGGAPTTPSQNLGRNEHGVKSAIVPVGGRHRFPIMSSTPVPEPIRRVLAENGLELDTRLYREAVFRDLAPTGDVDTFLLHAKTRPLESVIDVYGAGHLVQADSLGKGLAFAQTPTPNWQETMELRAMKGLTGAHPEARIEVEVTVADILAQGGKLYPVESVTVEKAWYCTMPIGSVEVRLVV